MIITSIFIVVFLSSTIVYLCVAQTIKLKKKNLLKTTVPALLTYSALLVMQPDSLLLSNLGVLTAAALTGSLIGTLLEKESSLAAFSITAAIVDVFSFSGGLTSKLIANYEQGKSLLLQFLAISIPLKGKIVPLVGLGDLLISAAVFYALLKLKYPAWQCFAVPVCGLLSALIVGLIIGGVFGIPFIAGAVLLFLIYNHYIRVAPRDTT